MGALCSYKGPVEVSFDWKFHLVSCYGRNSMPIEWYLFLCLCILNLKKCHVLILFTQQKFYTFIRYARAILNNFRNIRTKLQKRRAKLFIVSFELGDDCNNFEKCALFRFANMGFSSAAILHPCALVRLI